MLNLSGCVERTRNFIEKSKVLSFLLSPVNVMFCYGIFLLLYEIKFLRNFIPVVHPFLIGWGAVSGFYTLFIKGVVKKIPAVVLLVGFAAVTVVTALINLRYGVVSNIKAVVMTLLPLALFLPALITTPKNERNQTFFKILIGPAVVMLVFSFLAILTYVFKINQIITVGGITSHVGIRPFIEGVEGTPTLVYGLFVDTNHAAIYAICFAVLGAILFYECRRGFFKTATANKFGKIFGISSLVVNLAYFPLTSSRGGWLSLIVAFIFSGFLFFNLKEKSKGLTKKVLLPFLKTVLSIIISVAIIIALQYTSVGVSKIVFEITKTPPSIGVLDPSLDKEEIKDTFMKPADSTGSGRLEIWQEGIKLYAKNPIFGINTSNYLVVALKYFDTGHLVEGTAMHNSYLDLLVSYGVVGFVLLIGFFAVCFVKVLKKIFIGQNHSFSTYAVLGIAIIITCSSFFLSNVFINTSAMYFLLLTAVGYLIASVVDEKGKC